MHVTMQADTGTACSISLSLDACLASLRLLTASGLNQRVVTEDAVEAILAFLRSHVLLNVLVLYDGRLRQLHRPHLNEQGQLPTNTMASAPQAAADSV